MLKKFLAILATLALAAGLALTAASTAGAASSNPNDAAYWKSQYPNAVECYKYDPPGAANVHGALADNGKAVVLNTFNQSWPGDRWEVLIVKSGSAGGDGNGNAVYPLPTAGTPYYGPLNNGGQQGTVSHWIVCKGATPAPPLPDPKADYGFTPATCAVPQRFVLGETKGITWNADAIALAAHGGQAGPGTFVFHGTVDAGYAGAGTVIAYSITLLGAATESCPVVDTTPYVLVAWKMPSWTAPTTPTWPQTYFTSIDLATKDLGALDAALSGQCGQFQVDLYDDSAITTSLLGGKTPAVVLSGPNSPPEDFPSPAGWGKTYKLVQVTGGCLPPPVDVSGAVSVTGETCEVTTGSLVPGSITPDTTKTGVVYQLWNADKTVLLIDNFAADSGPLPNGTYYVKVLPLNSSYTVSDGNTWIQKVVGEYGDDCLPPVDVSGAVSVTGETCEVTTGSLVPGSITPDTTKTGVVYQLWNADKTVLLIDNFAADSGPLPNGTYYVKVLPLNSSYTVSDGNTWIQKVVGAYGRDCNEEVKVIGDPEAKQFCELNVEALGGTGVWISYLTISTSASNPAGSVQYRVFFDDNGTWVDKGVWPEGTYNAGPDTGNPYEIPYGTKVKVAAEATAGYQISTPKEWEYTFTQPGRCGLDTLPGVTPIITFNQTCATGPTYTLGIEGGPAGSILYSVNNGPFSAALGTFPATASSKFTIVADAVNGYGLAVPDLQTETYEVSHTYDPASVCGDLTTLALTGQDPTPFFALAGFLGLLGAALVRTANRTARRQIG